MDTSHNADMKSLCKWLGMDDASTEFWSNAPSTNNDQTVDMGPVCAAAQESSTKTVDMGPVYAAAQASSTKTVDMGPVHAAAQVNSLKPAHLHRTLLGGLVRQDLFQSQLRLGRKQALRDPPGQVPASSSGFSSTTPSVASSTLVEWPPVEDGWLGPNTMDV